MSNNPYCKVDELGFPKFTLPDFLRYRILSNDPRHVTGTSFLWAYKAAYLRYNKELIIKYAHQERIPVLLLAGVAVSEVGGTPDRLKAYGVLQVKQMVDKIYKNNKFSNSTSVGGLAIQLRAAAETLGIDPASLNTTQQLQLANCLLSDDFNIKVVARHLRELILYDYPSIDTRNLNDEQLILAGSRYNRGVARSKSDIVNSISSPINSQDRTWSEYGRRILEKRNTINQIMDYAK